MKSAPSIAATALAIWLASALTYVPVDWEMTDRPTTERVDLRFTNRTSDELCISVGDWPTPGGKLNYMRGRVALVVGDDHFPIDDFDTGYCDATYAPQLEDCAVHVPPGKTITGFLTYSDFRLPERLRFSKKQLVYPLNAIVCEKKGKKQG